jgi:hypothetical protein
MKIFEATSTIFLLLKIYCLEFNNKMERLNQQKEKIHYFIDIQYIVNVVSHLENTRNVRIDLMTEEYHDINPNDKAMEKAYMDALDRFEKQFQEAVNEVYANKEQLKYYLKDINHIENFIQGPESLDDFYTLVDDNFINTTSKLMTIPNPVYKCPLFFK